MGIDWGFMLSEGFSELAEGGHAGNSVFSQFYTEALLDCGSELDSSEAVQIQVFGEAKGVAALDAFNACDLGDQ